MNLKYLPFAQHDLGFFITGGIMLLFCAALYVFLRIKDWL
jgi:Mg2+ and Co2+ transporter CorA